MSVCNEGTESLLILIYDGLHIINLERLDTNHLLTLSICIRKAGEYDEGIERLLALNMKLTNALRHLDTVVILTLHLIS